MKQEQGGRCRPEPKTPDERLDWQLHQCGHYLYHHSAGPRQSAVIQLLQRNGPMSQRDIQASLGIQAGSVSELISKLESKGFLQRQRNEADRRKIVLSLTPRGEAVAILPREQTLSERYRALSREDRDRLSALLETLLDSWEVDR